MESVASLNQRLSLLYVGDLRDHTNAYFRFRALQELGFRVVAFDTKSFGSPNKWLIRWSYYTQWSPTVGLLQRNLISQVRLQQPSVIWVDKGLVIAKTTIEAARRVAAGEVIFVHYNPDDPFGSYARGLGRLPWRTFIQAIDAYDIHFVAREVNVPEFQQRGAGLAKSFDRSFDLGVHRPMVLNEAEQKRFATKVGFIGSYAPARSRSIAFLIKNGVEVAIYGDGWPKSEQWDVLEPYWRGESIYKDDYARAISGMNIALHFLRRENRDEQDSRSFEIPACGSFMLAERSRAHERLFRENEEAVFFDNDAELLQKTRYYLAHPREREKIAAAGRQRCLTSGYDHQSRVRQLLEVVMKHAHDRGITVVD